MSDSETDRKKVDKTTKKILVIDDSALMRRIICDIISLDDEFEVADMAADGEEGLLFLSRNTYDVVILDVVMPRVDGITVLKNMRQLRKAPPVVMFSSEVGDGTSVTIQALELGAFDFIEKPKSILDAKKEEFMSHFLQTLKAAVASQKKERKSAAKDGSRLPETGSISGEKSFPVSGERIVAIASSTGGPKALQRVIPYLPSGLDAPVLVVQHMPQGFTASLAQRLDELSPLHVVEARDGQKLEKGYVYLARGGMHMEVCKDSSGAGSKGCYRLKLSDGPTREGVKPCANYMYESLADTEYAGVVAVVLTGMGQDGTVGIQNLKSKKKVYTIAQDEETCVVYGMPRAVVSAGLADRIEPIDNVAQAIIKILGVY